MTKLEEKCVWGIHTLNDPLFLNNDVVAIGWKEMGDLKQTEGTRDAFKKRLVNQYPHIKKGAIGASAGMLYRFVYNVQIGDYIVFPSKIDRKINIGIVEGDYEFNPDEPEYAHQRKVKWLKHLPRTSFSNGALYEIGAILAFFSVKNYADEYLNALDKKRKKTEISSDDEESIVATSEDIVETTKDYILKRLSTMLKGYELEGFVADLLSAMGYRTSVSAQGGDRGIDITAYKDELPPRILVQVKSQDSDIGETTIQSLKGAMREGDYGLFITLSNYTKNAKKYLDSVPIIRGINGTDLVDLVLKYYGSMSEKYKRIIPLKSVYVPMPKEEE